MRKILAYTVKVKSAIAVGYMPPKKRKGMQMQVLCDACGRWRKVPIGVTVPEEGYWFCINAAEWDEELAKFGIL